MSPLTVAVVQARTGSSRLPSKILRELGGITVLENVLSRLSAAPAIDRIVVATTTSRGDDVVAEIANRAGARVTRGSEEDVLSRYVQAFDEHGGDVGVRITSDCPCLDPDLVTTIIEEFARRDDRVDYLSNTLERTYPRGYDVEVFRTSALQEAATLAQDPSSREHVTPFLYRHPDRYRIAQWTRPDPDGTAEWRVTLDTMDDWLLIERLYAALGREDPHFGLAAVEGHLRAHPELLALNSHVRQKPH